MHSSCRPFTRLTSAISPGNAAPMTESMGAPWVVRGRALAVGAASSIRNLPMRRPSIATVNRLTLRRPLPVVLGRLARKPLRQRHQEKFPKRVEVGLVHPPKVIQLVVDPLALGEHAAGSSKRLPKVGKLRRG